MSESKSNKSQKDAETSSLSSVSTNLSRAKKSTHKKRQKLMTRKLPRKKERQGRRRNKKKCFRWQIPRRRERPKRHLSRKSLKLLKFHQSPRKTLILTNPRQKLRKLDNEKSQLHRLRRMKRTFRNRQKFELCQKLCQSRSSRPNHRRSQKIRALPNRRMSRPSLFHHWRNLEKRDQWMTRYCLSKPRMQIQHNYPEGNKTWTNPF